MAIEKTQQRVDINARKIINGADADVVQLYPMKHTFAWDAYNAGNANHWLPTEINMQGDVEQWKTPGVLTDDEIRAFKTVLGFFTTVSYLLVRNNIYLHNIFIHIYKILK